MANTGKKTETPDLQGLTESEILTIPEGNLPPAMLDDFLARRQEVIQKKEAAQLDEEQYRLMTQARVKNDKEIEDAQRFGIVLAEYESVMRQISEREDMLLKELDREEKHTEKKLAEIDRRALRLHDGRRAYVGANGTYVDEKGQTLRGTDDQDARAQHLKHADAATWAEKTEVEQQRDEAHRMRQDVLDAREQRRFDQGKKLSAADMEARIRDRSAAMARCETEFHEQFESRRADMTALGPVTDDTYGGADYMAAYGLDKKGSLSKTFAPPAAGKGAQTTNTPVLSGNVPTTPTLSR